MNCLGILHNHIELVFGIGHLYTLCTKGKVPKDNIMTSITCPLVFGHFCQKNENYRRNSYSTSFKMEETFILIFFLTKI